MAAHKFIFPVVHEVTPSAAARAGRASSEPARAVTTARRSGETSESRRDTRAAE